MRKKIGNFLVILLGILLICGSIVLFKYEDIKAKIISDTNKKVEQCYFDTNCKEVKMNPLEQYALADNSGVDKSKLQKIDIKLTKNKNYGKAKSESSKNNDSNDSDNSVSKGNNNSNKDENITSEEQKQLREKEMEALGRNLDVVGAETITDTTSTVTPDGSEPKNNGVLGFFYANKIGLVEPIYQGASQANMAKGLATVGSSETLDENNVAIAGHRAWGTGIRFNRLAELGVGDTVTVKTRTKTTTYRVYDKFKVTPKDVDVLDETKDKELTLITCETYRASTNKFEDRLILKLKKV